MVPSIRWFYLITVKRALFTVILFLS
jgi:hypothetical protein